jgi:hypothetical protein
MFARPIGVPYLRVGCQILVLLLFGSVLLVACGGNDDAENAAPTPTTIPSTATSESTATTEPATPTEAASPASGDGPSIRVSGQDGPASDTFLFVVTGLMPDHPYTLVVRYPDGQEDAVEAIYDETTMELTGAPGTPYQGEPLSIWGVEPGDPTGEYTVEIRDGESDEVLTSATFEAE